MDLPQHHTDVLVVGGELAGLYTAALLARRGLRVLLLGHGEMESQVQVGVAKTAEWPFLVADFEAHSALRQVIEELGMRQDVRRLLPFATPPLQLIDDNHRLDLFEDELQRQTEFHREFGESGESLAGRLGRAAERLVEISQWLEAAPNFGQGGFFARRRLSKYLTTAQGFEERSNFLQDGLDREHALSRWMSGLIPFTTFVDSQSAAPLFAERAAARLVLGTRMSPGGERPMLAQLAHNFVTSHGGSIVAEAKVERLELKRAGAVTHIEGERTERIAHFVVDASRSRWLDGVLAPAKVQKRYEQDRDQLQPGSVVEALHLLFDLKALPEGIASRVLLTPPDQEPVMVAVDREPRDEKSQLKGKAVVSIATVAKSAGRPETQKYLRQLIMELMPFAEPYLKTETSGGKSARQLYKPRSDGLFSQLGPMRPVTTKHARLLRVGSDVMPAWGLEGEFRVALNAADQIGEKLLGKKPKADPVSKATAARS